MSEAIEVARLMSNQSGGAAAAALLLSHVQARPNEPLLMRVSDASRVLGIPYDHLWRAFRKLEELGICSMAREGRQVRVTFLAQEAAVA